MLKMRRCRNEPFEEGNLGFVRILEWTVGSSECGGFVFGPLEKVGKSIEGWSGHIVAEGDAVLILFSGQFVAQCCAAERPVGVCDDVHRDEVA